MQAVVLHTKTHNALEFVMNKQWDRASTRLRQAFARYKNMITFADVRFIAPSDIISYTDIMSGDKRIIPKISNVTQYGICISVFGQPDLTQQIPVSPIDLESAVAKDGIARVKEIVESGVDINVQTDSGHVLEKVLWRMTMEGGGGDIFDWLVERPDLDWNQQTANINQSAPLIQRVLPLVYNHLERLPWGMIDLHQQDSAGCNALHSYLSDRPVRLHAVRMLLQHGSATLALEITTALQRPVDMIKLPEVIAAIKEAESEAMTWITECLLQNMMVCDLVAIVTGYLTTFRLPPKNS
jgi:hypothetical protein